MHALSVPFTITFPSTDSCQFAPPPPSSTTFTSPTLFRSTAVGPLCQNSTAPLLPGTSNNGITGTWSPGTINTAVAGTTTYTFTSTDVSQCATSASISVTVTPQVTPTFTAVGPLCQNRTAPLLPGTTNNDHTATF